ncbi:MAG TPA: metallophosphoesterase [Cytophagaceae bacterium]
MANTGNMVRIGAVGDIHVHETDEGKWKEYFKLVSTKADILIIAGDLTDTGHLVEAEVLANELKHCTIPVVAVFGNHDYERGNQRTIKKMLEKEHVHVLDGESVVLNNLGFAGVKGFGGGFDKYMLSMFGEDMLKSFVHEAVNEALKLDRALTHLEGDESGNLKKIVITHYAPIQSTVHGEPEQIFPFLGSSRLVEPINRRQVVAAFHGHAHKGQLEGATSSGVKVFNVAKHVLLHNGFDPPLFLFDVEP